MIRTNSIICWKVLSCDRLTVLSPARVIALTVRNRESVKDTCRVRGGVDEPQNITALIKHVKMK
jgi:hypothetical protein